MGFDLRVSPEPLPRMYLVPYCGGRLEAGQLRALGLLLRRPWSLGSEIGIIGFGLSCLVVSRRLTVGG